MRPGVSWRERGQKVGCSVQVRQGLLWLAESGGRVLEPHIVQKIHKTKTQNRQNSVNWVVVGCWLLAPSRVQLRPILGDTTKR